MFLKGRSDSKDSSKKRGGGSEFKVTSPLDEIPNIETLDTELKSIILEQLDEESLGGDVCFSDEESTVSFVLHKNQTMSQKTS